MNLRAFQTEPEPTPSPGGSKFAYRSGSKPLAGYTIKRGIGSGGFGEVYYATSDAGKELALKLIRRNLDIEIRGVTQCLNLKHPNLVALHDIKQDEHGDSWVVMEYVSGDSLEGVVGQHPHGLPVTEALRWFRGIGAAVAYLHDHGIVHRDLKPGNIFSDEGIVKVGDYGLSKFISCSRRSGQTGSVGTVHYMAPEVANGRYGKEIDIYALGIMLYEMLTGHVPFEGESLGEILMKHLTTLPDLSALAEPYRSVVARALAKDPAQRFTTVAEMVDALPALAESSYLSGRFSDVRLATASRVPPAIAGKPIILAQVAPTANEEPIFRAVRGGWRDLRGWWHGSNFHPLQQVAVIGVVFIALAITAHLWLAVLFPAALFYGGYLVVRSLILAMSSSKPSNLGSAHVRTTARTLPHPSQLAGASRAVGTFEKPLPAMIVKPLRQRLADLLGGMLLSAVVVLVMSGLLMVIRSHQHHAQALSSLQSNSLLVWLTLTGMLGTWAVMLPATFWQGTRGEPLLRRFVLLAAGMCLGLIVGVLHNALNVNLPIDQNLAARVPSSEFLNHGFFNALGAPLPMAFAGYFGFLFLLPRWWRRADPLRTHRVSIRATLFDMFWALAVHLFWPVPQPWGVMAALTISVAVQLCSPWQRRPITV